MRQCAHNACSIFARQNSSSATHKFAGFLCTSTSKLNRKCWLQWTSVASMLSSVWQRAVCDVFVIVLFRLRISLGPWPVHSTIWYWPNFWNYPSSLTDTSELSNKSELSALPCSKNKAFWVHLKLCHMACMGNCAYCVQALRSVAAVFSSEHFSHWHFFTTVAMGMLFYVTQVQQIHFLPLLWNFSHFISF